MMLIMITIGSSDDIMVEMMIRMPVKPKYTDDDHKSAVHDDDYNGDDGRVSINDMITMIINPVLM